LQKCKFDPLTKDTGYIKRAIVQIIAKFSVECGSRILFCTRRYLRKAQR